MVAAESRFDIPGDEVYLVSQRKYNLDATRPGWERAFFRLLFLPFVRFAFRWMHVPAVGAMEPDGSLVIIEQQGVYFNEDDARRACKGEFWSWKRLPLNTALPDQSVQHKGHEMPRSIMPDRYRRRTFPLAPAPVQQLRELEASINKLSRKAAGA